NEPAMLSKLPSISLALGVFGATLLSSVMPVQAASFIRGFELYDTGDGTFEELSFEELRVSAFEEPTGSTTPETSNGNYDLSGQFTNDQLRVEIDDNTAGAITFSFTNNVGIKSSVKQIYFGRKAKFEELFDLTPFNLTEIGTDFGTDSAKPGTIPNDVAKVFTAYAVDAEGNPTKGIDAATDLFRISFRLLNPQTNLADIRDLFVSDSLSIGMHVQSIDPNGDSDWYISSRCVNNCIITPNPDPNPVPEPFTALGTATALGLGALAQRKRLQQQNKTKALVSTKA
ncbi:MAG: PEP-CTERM sorting domain-containing protein, partial [Leptolyngbyaceae bacterium]|nr:PEP-CTERM sorting domain-containing protein [Leptolyngbyaceae bacterium]